MLSANLSQWSEAIFVARSPPAGCSVPPRWAHAVGGPYCDRQILSQEVSTCRPPGESMHSFAVGREVGLQDHDRSPSARHDEQRLHPFLQVAQ